MNYNWTPNDHIILIILCKNNYDINWNVVSAFLPNKNIDEIINYWNLLNLKLNSNHWTIEEDDILLQLSKFFDNKWKTISKYLPNRSITAIRNRWQRIERAQKLKNGLSIKFGGKLNLNITKLKYKCKFCGEFKRGHTCLSKR